MSETIWVGWATILLQVYCKSALHIEKITNFWSENLLLLKNIWGLDVHTMNILIIDMYLLHNIAWCWFWMGADFTTLYLYWILCHVHPKKVGLTQNWGPWPLKLPLVHNILNFFRGDPNPNTHCNPSTLSTFTLHYIEGPSIEKINFLFPLVWPSDDFKGPYI